MVWVKRLSASKRDSPWKSIFLSIGIFPFLSFLFVLFISISKLLILGVDCFFNSENDNLFFVRSWKDIVLLITGIFLSSLLFFLIGVTSPIKLIKMSLIGLIAGFLKILNTQEFIKPIYQQFLRT